MVGGVLVRDLGGDLQGISEGNLECGLGGIKGARSVMVVKIKMSGVDKGKQMVAGN